MATKPKCIECGAEIKSRANRGGPKSVFCSKACNMRFFNRRMKRGALLYDVYMASRYDREVNKSGITTMAQMASRWRDEDKAEREGRRSWNDGRIDPLDRAAR